MLSIIITLYNNQNIIDDIFIKINKLLDQKNEIILIDDCSSDYTYVLLKQFIDQNNYNNMILSCNKRNMGPSYSRNKGLKIARGEYIAFLDSDDDWHPQKLDIQIKIMKKTNSKICGTMHKVISNDRLNIEQNIKYNKEDIPCRIVSWPKILFVSPFATPSVVIDKSLKNYYYDENMRYSEDYNLWMRIVYKYKAIKIMLPLTYTFKHDYISDGKSLSSNSYKMQMGVHNSFIKLLRDKDILIKDKLLILLAIPFSWIKYIKREIG